MNTACSQAETKTQKMRYEDIACGHKKCLLRPLFHYCDTRFNTQNMVYYMPCAQYVTGRLCMLSE